VSNNYQSGVLDSSAAGRLALPETVSVALEEIAADMREGLLALAVGTGLQVMAQLMEADVAAVCGPKGKHNPGREAVRHGSEAGSVTLGGRRVPVRRPRMRTADGAAELPVPCYELFSSSAARRSTAPSSATGAPQQRESSPPSCPADPTAVGA
jgi:putative transposase